ncbi:MAG: hypothetical protein JWO52_6955, partial [Gammaproteobacteria bacterium]|nr:hypothetical protein [Gammaproteobacteria bacterium]
RCAYGICCAESMTCALTEYLRGARGRSRTDTLLRAADFESAWVYPKCLVRQAFYPSTNLMCKKMCKFLLDNSLTPCSFGDKSTRLR